MIDYIATVVRTSELRFIKPFSVAAMFLLQKLTATQLESIHDYSAMIYAVCRLPSLS
jgi:hypothetical protein